MFQKILFDTNLIELLQSLFPSLDTVFILLTSLGDSLIYGSLTMLIYWCWDKRWGAKLIYLLALSGYLNYVLKMSFALPRPPAEIRLVDKKDISYGFPSGHSQNAAAFWGWLGLKLGKKALGVAIFIIFLVALSRVYLGVHYLGDVLAGLVIGWLCVWTAIKLERIFPGRFDRFTFVAPVLAMVLLFLSLRLFPEVAKGDPAAPLGSLLGFSLGVIAERRFIDFATRVDAKRRLFRLVVGFVLMGGFMFGVGFWLSGNVYLKFIKYALVSFAGAFLAPLIFKMIKL